MHQLQKFLGAAVTRVKIITSSLTVLVGLSMITPDKLVITDRLAAEMGALASESLGMMGPLEVIKRHLDTYPITSSDLTL